MRAGAFNNRVSHILHIFKQFLITAVKGTQENVPDFIADLCFDINGRKVVDRNIRVHEGLETIRTFHLDSYSADHHDATSFVVIKSIVATR